MKINPARSIVVLVAVAVAMQLGNRPTYGQPGGPLRFAFETIDVPFLGVTRTQADGSSTRAISGEFDDAAGTHGFALSGGAFTRFDVPFDGANVTSVNGINVKGEMSGNYSFDGGTSLHGYFRSQDGHVTSLDPPGSIRTQVGFLNAQAQVVGVYRDAGSTRHGFVWQAGTFKTFDEPDAMIPGGGTVPFGINDRGQIVGDYVDRNDFGRHGFLLSNGAYTTIDVPGAFLTVAEGINNPGDIAGVYLDSFFNAHGFVLHAGVFTIVDVPNSQETQVFNISALAEIVGEYVDQGGVMHGFVGRPVR